MVFSAPVIKNYSSLIKLTSSMSSEGSVPALSSEEVHVLDNFLVFIRHLKNSIIDYPLIDGEGKCVRAKEGGSLFLLKDTDETKKRFKLVFNSFKNRNLVYCSTKKPVEMYYMYQLQNTYWNICGSICVETESGEHCNLECYVELRKSFVLGTIRINGKYIDLPVDSYH